MNTTKGTTAKAVQRASNGTAGDKSFRVLYYGSAAAGSVPFKWESQPGTPKLALIESSLPPLTPPPSYQMHKSSMQLSSKRSGFLKNIFRRNIERMSKTKVRRMVSVVKGYGEQENGGGGSPVARCMGGGLKRSYRINNKMKKAIQWFVHHGYGRIDTGFVFDFGRTYWHHAHYDVCYARTVTGYTFDLI